MEIWKDIKGYEGLYQVSNLGRVKSLRKTRTNKWGSYIQNDVILKPTLNKYRGYMNIGLHKDKSVITKTIHRLVAETFLPNPNNYKCVNHKDFNRCNNCLDNLEWCSHKYNTDYSMEHGRYPKIQFYKTNTGHHHISYRESKKEYRVKIRGKEYHICKTLEEAINLRDSILEEVMKDGK